MRWFEVDPCYVFHVFNGWTEGSKICCDVVRYDQAPLFPTLSGDTPVPAPGRPFRWTLDLGGATNRVHEEALTDLTGEFPRCDERYSTLPYRHAYFTVTRPENRASGSVFSALGHQDLVTRRSDVFDVPSGDLVSEPVFVPRASDAPEGDGYVLSVHYLAAENRSDLIILDAQHLAAGPVARVSLSHRVPAGFHGSWVGAV
jgi:carotenoid cleavage dioxygenase